MMQRPHKTSLALAMLLALGAFRHAGAQGCTASTSGLAFGPYRPLTFVGKLDSTDVTSDTSVVISCTGVVSGGNYTVTLGPSASGPGDRISVRYMTGSGGGDEMAFNVYHDPAHTIIWGDGMTAGSPLVGSVPPGDSTRTRTVYGRIPGGQNKLRAGSYSTWLTMTLTFSP
jgi:spore coat protein U-like protein